MKSIPVFKKKLKKPSTEKCASANFRKSASHRIDNVFFFLLETVHFKIAGNAILSINRYLLIFGPLFRHYFQLLRVKHIFFIVYFIMFYI